MTTIETKPRELVYVQANCAHCDEALLPKERLLTFEYDDGKKAPVHVECFMRKILGSAPHQLHECPCYLGDEGREEPAGLTKRQCARLALETYYALQGETQMGGFHI